MRLKAGSDLAAPVRVALLAIPIAIGTMAVFVFRRLDGSDWDFGEPVLVLISVVVLLGPGMAILLLQVRKAFLFLVGLHAVGASEVAGIALAASSDDGQAGLNLLLTPVLAIGVAATLGALDPGGRAGRGVDTTGDDVNTP